MWGKTGNLEDHMMNLPCYDRSIEKGENDTHESHECGNVTGAYLFSLFLCPRSPSKGREQLEAGNADGRLAAWATIIKTVRKIDI
ncbi:MAG TPA: hypothetical protein DCK78_04285 [Paenibacillus lactis]|nr:hypothetical protein [Paenibacillus lactis]